MEINAEHRFALHAVVRIRFHRTRNGRTRVEDTLVQNLHRAGIVVHGVVCALRQQLTAGAHHHTPLGNAGCVELNFVRLRRLELTRDAEFVVFGNLFRHGVRRIVEFRVGKSSCQRRVANGFRQMAAEGFDHREENASRSRIHGVALHKVEVAVRHAARIVVQTVEPHHREQALVLHRREGEIREVDPCGVGEVLHIERKAFALHVRCAERIHVAHHQRPVALARRAGRVLQALHQERTRVVFQVGRELAHLIVLSFIGVFKRHGQHLIGLQSRAQRNVTQIRVESIFRGGEQACALYLFIVVAAGHADAVEERSRLCDVAHSRQCACDGGVFVVRRVGRNCRATLRCPALVLDALGFAQVGQCHEVARVVRRRRSVRHP